jgi:hypothetical protein
MMFVNPLAKTVTARIHAVEVGAARREREAGELADVVLAIRPPRRPRWARPHRDVRPAERVGNQAVGEHRQVPDAALVVHDVDRVAAGVGDHEAAAVKQDVDGVGVDRRVADRRVRIHVALERPEVGDLPDLPMVLDP